MTVGAASQTAKLIPTKWRWRQTHTAKLIPPRTHTHHSSVIRSMIADMVVMVVAVLVCGG
jgi:hypothetical protein